MVLLSKERVSAKNLAAMFEVSLRTIYRDIDAINRAGIPVRATSGVGGGIEIMGRYKVDKAFFSTADLSAILTGLTSLSTMIGGTELLNAFAKVKSFIPAERAHEIEMKINQISIDLSPWMSHRNIQPYLEITNMAIQEQKLLSFEYTDRHDNKTNRLAEPYQLVFKSSQWYLHGYCLKRNAFRLFRLSRISNLQIRETFFIPREYQNPQLDFTEIIATLQSNIKIRIHKSIMDRVLDYCGYENFAMEDEGYYIVDFPFIENEYYYNILFGFGDKCECLEPANVRAEMKRRIHSIFALYEK